VLYHLVQRVSGHAAASPWPMLTVAYGIGFAVAMTVTLLSPHVVSRSDRITGLLLGLAALGIEAGIFFVYRAGWPLASASVISNAVVTLVLATIGILAFGEHLTVARGAGIALAVAGATLIARG